jgi:hypothetical protein
MLEWSRLRPRTGAVAGAATTLGTVVLVASALASGDCRPTISGNPIVGHVLTADVASTGDESVLTRHHDGAHHDLLFKWQGCDPAAADCSGSSEEHERTARSASHENPNWTDLTESSSTGTSYTVQGTDLGHFIRVVVRREGWWWHSHWRASSPVGPVTEEAKVAPPPPPPPPAPEHGIAFLVQPAGGTVTIKEPGASGFTQLNGEEKIPVNSVLDTRGGTVQLTAATGDYGNKTPDDSVELWGGLIRIEQPADTNALATARLVQKLRCGKGRRHPARAGKSSGPVAATSGKRRRRVWGSGHGGYRTGGSGGTGSVRGTTWLTMDTCRGTFFKVTDGIGISVFDIDLGQTFELGPGQSYFARNR